MGASILILQGDAEARLFAGAEETLQACFPAADVKVTRVWTTRSDMLGSMAAVLAEKRDMVIFSVLPDAALPAWRGPRGPFVVHKAQEREGSSIEAGSVQEGLVDPEAAARALEPVIAELQERGSAVALCNVFRHVQGAPSHRADDRNDLRHRIRAVNLEVMNLSRRTGCFVLDVDRVLAHEGGATLGADCFGGEGRAEELAMEQLVALVMEALPGLAGLAGGPS
jgi:hypothetical protein